MVRDLGSRRNLRRVADPALLSPAVRHRAQARRRQWLQEDFCTEGYCADRGAGVNLAEAQAGRHSRGEQLALAHCDAVAMLLCDAVQEAASVNLAGTGGLKNYQMVGPSARKKLSGLLNHYRKLARPFTACVRDNTKRFGAEGAKKVCAVLTDLEKGTTRWRSGGSKKSASKLSDELLAEGERVVIDHIDDELFGLLHAISEIDYRPIVGLEETA